MANKNVVISDELLAAYLDGNTNEQETLQVLQALKTDKQMQEVLTVALQIDEDKSLVPHASLHHEVPPMLQVAAICGENVCAVLCEIFILQRHNVAYHEEWLIKTARGKGWLKPEGTPLYCIGNLLAYSGMFINRQYDSTIEDITKTLKKGNDVIVGVDREKLYAEENDPEDLTNHAVVVTDINDDIVTVYDPYKSPTIAKIPLKDFLNAWKESHNYMVHVLQTIDDYEPHPINVDSIPLDGDLEELQEAIAENAHNTWAEERIKQGWSYGKEWDETKKHDPSLVPYNSLPDSEKEYDRITAFNTIKLVKKLGFNIIKEDRHV